MFNPLENSQVIGDYYPEPEPRQIDEDEAFERWQSDNDPDSAWLRIKTAQGLVMATESDSCPVLTRAEARALADLSYAISQLRGAM